MSYLTDIARSIKRYDPSDKAALREFQREYFGPGSRQCDDSFSEWLFERNPHRDPNRSSLWLCERDGVVVGQQASIPVSLKVGELEYRAAWMIDWMIHPGWRLKGVAPALFAASRDSTEVMLGLGVEDAAYRAFLRAGWREVGKLTLFVRPLDPKACAKGLNAPKLVAKLAPRFLVRSSARVIGRIAAAITRMHLERIEAFDERVDSVWTTAGREYSVLVKRDFAALRWRFDESPYRALYERYYLERRGQVIGYAVIRFENWYGHVIGRVVDYLTQPRWVAPLLALLIEEVNAKGAVAVFIEQLNARSEKALWSLGCLRARTSHRMMVNVRDSESPLAAALDRAGGSFIMPADSDYDHIAIALSEKLFGSLVSPALQTHPQSHG